jgi:hypothetical protein
VSPFARLISLPSILTFMMTSIVIFCASMILIYQSRLGLSRKKCRGIKKTFGRGNRHETRGL